jgi:anthranilate synthase component 1
VVRQGRLHLQAAAGIVADSDPAEEAREIDNKLRALAMAAESLRPAAAVAGAGDPEGASEVTGAEETAGAAEGPRP